MSNKTYTPVTLNEMKEVLRADKGWRLITEPSSREYIFEFPLSNSPHIVVRIMTSIIESGVSRDCGKDAIRVYAADIKNAKGYIKTRRVYRIGTWRENLKRVATEVFQAALKRRERE
jgi:hypothetical protein